MSTTNLHSRSAAVKASLKRQTRWGLLEIIFWVAAVASWFFLPDQHLILTEITIFAVLALSIDLILGYAGIVTLGQSALYGTGAYASGLFSIYVTGDPLTGLLVGALAGAAVALATSLLLLRGADLTRLMVTLGVAAVLYEIANQAAWLTGAPMDCRALPSSHYSALSTSTSMAMSVTRTA